jgi:ketosteroid isomerase-like protein
VDVAHEAQQLLETDRAWAGIAAAGTNADSVLSFWTDDARVVLPGQPVLNDKAAIREMVTRSMAIPGFHVTWTPESAVVSQAGDLAYTFGTNEFTAPDSTGTLATTKGRYITVWRKEPDGRWRCVMDYSNPGPTQVASTP